MNKDFTHKKFNNKLNCLLNNNANKLNNTSRFFMYIALTILNSCGGEKTKKTNSVYCTDYVPKYSKRFVKTEDSLVKEYFSNKTVIDKIKKLPNGSILNVFFYDGNNISHNSVLNTISEWSKYCNIKFRKTDNVLNSDVRISFRKIGYWSAVGTDANYCDTTMSLQNLDQINDPLEFKRVVLHEFGHVLGLIHEHQSPENAIKWDKEAVYNYYKQPPNKWGKSVVDDQIFKKYSSSLTNYSKYDSLSIMHYPIPAFLTTDGFSVGWNNDLSETDKQYIYKFYPF